ncbi:hypothetical protein WS54_18580 [Burkholderia sp. NRF60-BP8]|nr:hypothetical protein WS54_18580 [Burkholderia sp. NRF60-BP8]KVA09356.1 hypothetical protein WS54_20990 [Burkholderia sp. NRF60-BP8]
MHDDGRQHVTLKKPAFHVANLTSLQFRTPYAIFRTLLAGTRDGPQWQTCRNVLRLLLLRNLLGFPFKRQAGFRIEILSPRHLIDHLVRRLLWRDSDVLLLLPLECTIPRRELRGRERYDLVNLRNSGITAIVTINEFAD